VQRRSRTLPYRREVVGSMPPCQARFRDPYCDHDAQECGVSGTGRNDAIDSNCCWQGSSVT
jgi:hypothetical protein